MNKSQYSLEALVNDKTVREYKHENKIFIEGRSGSEYSLRVRNNNYSRVLAVVTVDGINVISGKPSENNDRMGYIVNAYSSIKVQGFRKDLDTVGAFKFCDKDSAYSEEVGLKGNTGIIGVRIFDEVQTNYTWLNDKYPGTPYPYNQGTYWTTNTGTGNTDVVRTSYTSNNCTLRSKSITYCSNPFDTGTTWGKAKSDSVTTVSFEACCQPTETIEIYYASKNGLKKLGVDIGPEKKEVVFPKAFGHFATPPKGWKNN